MTIADHECTISASVGIAYRDGHCHAQVLNADVLSNQADMAIYAAKRDSGNAWRTHSIAEDQADPKAEKPDRKTG